MLDHDKVFGNPTAKETRLIGKIVERARATFSQEIDGLSLNMDLTAAHHQRNLDLEGLLDADNFNFAHDVAGITRHMDRETGTLDETFVPRFEKRNTGSEKINDLFEWKDACMARGAARFEETGLNTCAVANDHELIGVWHRRESPQFGEIFDGSDEPIYLCANSVDRTIIDGQGREVSLEYARSVVRNGHRQPFRFNQTLTRLLDEFDGDWDALCRFYDQAG